MLIVYSNSEFKEGTDIRRIYFYDDDGDIIMTDEPVYEDEEYEEEEEEENENEND